MKATDFDVKRVYYDSNVWISYIMGNNDHFYSVCKPMIDAVEAGRCVAIVPNLIIMESINVIRKRMTKKQPVVDGYDPSTVEASAEELVRSCTQLVTRLAKQKKIIVPEDIATHHNVLAKLQALTGYVKFEHYCSACKKSYHIRDRVEICPSCGVLSKAKRKYKYKGLGHTDLEHAYLAVYYRASTFYSTDKAFDALTTDPDFAPVVFQQL